MKYDSIKDIPLNTEVWGMNFEVDYDGTCECDFVSGKFVEHDGFIVFLLKGSNGDYITPEYNSMIYRDINGTSYVINPTFLDFFDNKFECKTIYNSLIQGQISSLEEEIEYYKREIID